MQYLEMSVKEMYEQWIDPFSQNQDIFSGRIPYAYSCIDGKDKVFLAIENHLIVGISAIHQNENNPNIWESLFTAIDPSYRNKGIAKRLLNMRFQFIAKNGQQYLPSKYSNDGKKYLSKYIDFFCKKYNVTIIEQKKENYEKNTSTHRITW
jgi:GNAT superfamily N-acetyltransferase